MFKGTVVNPTCQSTNGGSLAITPITVPLKERFFLNLFLRVKESGGKITFERYNTQTKFILEKNKQITYINKN